MPLQQGPWEMVYVIEGDICLLGVIPKTFPMIGEFGGEEQHGDGQDKFEVDAKYKLRYIATESSPQIDVLQGEARGELHHGLQQGGDLQG